MPKSKRRPTDGSPKGYGGLGSSTRSGRVTASRERVASKGVGSTHPNIHKEAKSEARQATAWKKEYQSKPKKGGGKEYTFREKLR